MNIEVITSSFCGSLFCCSIFSTLKHLSSVLCPLFAPSPFRRFTASASGAYCLVFSGQLNCCLLSAACFLSLHTPFSMPFRYALPALPYANSVLSA